MFNAVRLNPLPRLRSTARTLRDATVGAALTGGLTLRGRPLRHRLFPERNLSRYLYGRHVLISGASSGIGRALALKVADAGAIAILVARSAAKLQELADQIALRGGRASIYAADLSSRASTDALLERLASDGVRVDVLVNNAGRSIRRALGDSCERLHDFERTMALNYFGSLRLILGLLPSMRARKEGHVINVSSAGVSVGTPLFSAYVASKAALDAFTRVAAAEMRDERVRFTTIHMPLVRTPMIVPTRAYRNAPALSPEDAAELVLRAIVTREKHLGTHVSQLLSLGHIVAPEALERMLSLGYRLSPAGG